MKMRQAHLDTKMKMRQAHLDHENEDALLVALLCAALPRRIASRHCIVASRCRIASRLVVDPLVVASRCCVSLLHRRASRVIVVASRCRIPLAPLVDALLRVSSPYRVSSSLHCQFHCRVASHRRIMASSIFLSKLLNAL